MSLGRLGHRYLRISIRAASSKSLAGMTDLGSEVRLAVSFVAEERAERCVGDSIAALSISYRYCGCELNVKTIPVVQFPEAIARSQSTPLTSGLTNVYPLYYHI